jgi:hypothetical protein
VSEGVAEESGRLRDVTDGVGAEEEEEAEAQAAGERDEAEAEAEEAAELTLKYEK